jgi:hypothetical protein
MKKLKEFITFFCLLFATEAISYDLGIITRYHWWDNYVGSLLFALMWTFLVVRKKQDPTISIVEENAAEK